MAGVESWDRTRTRLLFCFRRRATTVTLSVARRVLNSAMTTFPEAPLQCRTAEFPRSGFKPWLRPEKLLKRLSDKEELGWTVRPIDVAYEVGAARQRTVRSPRTIYPQPQRGIGTVRQRCIY